MIGPNLRTGWWWLLVSLGMLLAACGGQVATPNPPTATPGATGGDLSVVATDEPRFTPTQEQPASAGEESTSAALLPAPLYFLNDGQIARLEPDATTVTPITSESPGSYITAFDVSPTDGSLAYSLVNAEGAYTMMQADATGENSTVLLQRPGMTLDRLLWSPDGTRIACSLTNLQPTDPQIEAGVYLLDVANGEPDLLQPNDPNPDPTNPPPPDARFYTPLAWSPDGTRLLLVSAVFEGGGLAIKHLDDGTLLELVTADDVFLPCCEASWSADGTAVYVASTGNLGLGVGTPGLWMVDAARGTTTTLVAGEQDGIFALVKAPHEFADEQLRLFLTMTEQAPAEILPDVPPLTMHQMPVGNGEPEALRDDEHDIVEVLWATDGSGAVVQTFDPPASGYEAEARLLWLPADGAAAQPLPVMGQFLQWGQAAPAEP